MRRAGDHRAAGRVFRGAVVFGLEGDISATNKKGSALHLPMPSSTPECRITPFNRALQAGARRNVGWARQPRMVP